MHDQFTTSRRLGLLAAVGLSAAVFAACGSDASGSNGEDSGTLRVTTLGLCNEISVYWAQDRGIFEKNGLDVELVKSTGGAAALTALQSGDIDLAFTNPFSTMIAASQGIDLRWVATAYETTDMAGEGTNAVAVAKDSGITDAAGLNDQTIGVNEIGGINQIITTEWLAMEGADVESVQFVALPFNELASAVATGKIGAAQVPAQNVDPELGLVSLDDPYVTVGDGSRLVFAGYVASAESADSREEEMSAFQESLVEANDELNAPENADAKFALEAAQCNQEADYLRTLNENIYEARVDVAALGRMAEILEGQGLVEDPVAPEDLVLSYTAVH